MASTIKVTNIDTPDSTGNITVDRPLSGSGASLTALNATNLASGTVAAARLPALGKVLQVKIVYDSSSQSLATSTYTATGLSLAITPSATSSKIFCQWNMQALLEANEGFGTKLKRDSTDIQTSPQLYDVFGASVADRAYGIWAYLDSPSSTSSITYSVEVASYGGNTIQLNDSGNTHLTLWEIGA